MDLLNNIDDKKKIFLEKKNKKEIKEFNFIKKKKISLLNIDCQFRNKIPKNIIATDLQFLPKNPLSVEKDSLIVKINYPNHGLEIGDRITVKNVAGSSRTLYGSIYFYTNFNYMIVKYSDHGIESNYLNYYDNFQIEISLESTLEMTMIRNIPINSVFGIFNATYVDDNIEIDENILEQLEIDLETFKKDYFLIKILRPYNGNSNELYNIDGVTKITINSIGGIPLSFINADYPVTLNQRNGYHTIVDKNTNNIFLESKVKGYKNTNGGGDKVNVFKIINTLPGFPEANDYTIFLKKSFNNVSKIELVSTELTFVDYIIKDKGTGKNNVLYWQQYDDGGEIYSVELPEGNYSASLLVSSLQEKINQAKRIGSTDQNIIYNFFTISLNLFTQEVIFNALKEDILSKPLNVEEIDIDGVKYYQMNIFHPNNLVQVDDLITISSGQSIGAVPRGTINTSHTVYKINTQEQSYSVILPAFNALKSGINEETGEISLDGDGGNSVKIRSRAMIRFLFDRKDTIGGILGFKNTGEASSITDFKTQISNIDEYANQNGFDLNFVGNKDTSKNILNLVGDNFYFLMYLNDFESIISNNNIPNSFAKILLTGGPGDVIFDSYVNTAVEFDYPISSLSELRVKFTYPDGSLINFRNSNHSFTLKITEEVSYPRETQLSSNDLKYIDYLEDNPLEI
jgi:hypothetical protein